MFKSIKITNFRCFSDLSLEPLTRINLISGKNDVGKTALLEALFLVAGAPNISLLVNIASFRGLMPKESDVNTLREHLWEPLFFNFDDTLTISITASNAAGAQRAMSLKLGKLGPEQLTLPQEPTDAGLEPTTRKTLHLSYSDSRGVTHDIDMRIDQTGITTKPVPEEPETPGIFLYARKPILPQEDATRFGKLEVAEETYDLLNALRVVEPRFKRLSTIYSGGVPLIYGDIGIKRKRMLPLALVGDGVGRLTSILLAIANCRGGIVLVDEIENGFHHSILRKIWLAIEEAARHFNVQLVATTHSFECIRAAHKAFERTSYDFCLHRLEQVKNKIKVTTYDQETLSAALEADLEVR